MNIFGFLNSKTPLCGLDLGSTWAKTVKISRNGRSVNLDSFVRAPWTSKDLDNPSSRALKVKALWEHIGLRDKVIVSSMAGHSVIVKKVFFKSGLAKELERHIKKEARQHIPFDLEDVYLDYQIMGQADNNDSVEVLLVASKKKVVEELISVMDQSGLSLGIIDVDAFALSNCFEFNYPEFAQEASYLIDIGGTQSIFVIFWQKQPVFFREMSFGGRQLTDIIVRNLDIGKVEAEKIKIDGPSSQKARENSDISAEMADTIQSWITEIKRLTGFYRTSVPEPVQAGRLFLSGGGSLLKGILSMFSQELDIEARYLDPWKNLQTSMNDFDLKYLDSIKPQFAVATGLALRGVL